MNAIKAFKIAYVCHIGMQMHINFFVQNQNRFTGLYSLQQGLLYTQVFQELVSSENVNN
jgi:hypothetical protein